MKDDELSLISISDVSRMLGVSVMTLRRWDKIGKLPAIRMGENSVRRYKREDIENMVRLQKN